MSITTSFSIEMPINPRAVPLAVEGICRALLLQITPELADGTEGDNSGQSIAISGHGVSRSDAVADILLNLIETVNDEDTTFVDISISNAMKNEDGFTIWGQSWRGNTVQRRNITLHDLHISDFDERLLVTGMLSEEDI